MQLGIATHDISVQLGGRAPAVRNETGFDKAIEKIVRVAQKTYLYALLKEGCLNV